jgi:hypothetical protein
MLICLGPDVYRKIFTKYCQRGGPLRAFNVSEIVDEAVSLKDQLHASGEQDVQWVQQIYDPRVLDEV